MVHLAKLPTLVELVRDRKLQPRDLFVFLAMLAHLNPKTGRMRVRLSVVAEEMGVAINNLYLSLGRLRKADAMAKGVDTIGPFYMCHPYLLSVGSDATRGKLWGIWKHATENDGDMTGLAEEFEDPGE